MASGDGDLPFALCLTGRAEEQLSCLSDAGPRLELAGSASRRDAPREGSACHILTARQRHLAGRITRRAAAAKRNLLVFPDIPAKLTKGGQSHEGKFSACTVSHVGPDALCLGVFVLA